MDEKPQAPVGLPLPSWCFVLLAVPTFYMPLVYVAVAGLAIVDMLTGQPVVPEWLRLPVHQYLFEVAVMWPVCALCSVYVAWVLFSKRLAWREKAMWLVIVLLANMIGMPLFYVFMVRRYLGLEGRSQPRDEAALERLLKRHAVSRDRLSPEQLAILRSNCRRHRLARWGVVPSVFFTALMLYMAAVFIPDNCIRLFASPTLFPTRTVIVEPNGTKQEIGPAPGILRQHVQLVMLCGATAGMMGIGGVAILFQSLTFLWDAPDRRDLIGFAKTIGTDIPQS